MLTPQSTRGSPRDAPYDPRQSPKKSFEVWCASHSAPSVTNSIHDPRVTGRTDAYQKEASVDVVTWLLSRGKQRHGSVVQGNATPDRRRPERPPGEPSRVSAQAARGVHGVAQRYWPSTCRAVGGVHDRERP